ncbi:MAG: hypothetical protein GY716_21280, partial [bacterium]|nr:hypothetical protein [bacterium]
MEVRVRGGGRAKLQSLKPGRAVDLGVLISVQEISSLESLFIAPRRYHLGTELRFTAERPDVAYLGSGWSYAEDWGTWSDGDASVVTLPMTCPAGGELAARFRVGAYVNELRPQATVHVTSRGREL